MKSLRTHDPVHNAADGGDGDDDGGGGDEDDDHDEDDNDDNDDDNDDFLVYGFLAEHNIQQTRRKKFNKRRARYEKISLYSLFICEPVCVGRSALLGLCKC